MISTSCCPVAPGFLFPTADGVVNIQRLVAESTLGKAATAQLRAFQTRTEDHR
jgi:hypothetical protein